MYNTTIDAMKLIVFDWDQTLWSSWDVHVMAAQYAADVLGLPAPSKKWIAHTFSVPFARHMKLLFPRDTQEATRHYMHFYHTNVKKIGHLFDGVPETLAALKDNGYMVALLSDKRDTYGSQELKTTVIADLFDYVLFLSDGRPYKPDPEGLQQVMDALSVKKEQVLYVGDSYVDIQCARRTGVTSAAALWGSVNAEAVLRERPDYVWKQVSEVIGALKCSFLPPH